MPGVLHIGLFELELVDFCSANVQPCNLLIVMAAFISKFQVKCCSKWGEITMDDAQCGENTKAWGYAIIVKG